VPATVAKNTICLWYDRDAEAAAQFYARTFPDSRVGGSWRAPSDYPSGKKGDVLGVEFTVLGIPCFGLNGGPAFKPNNAFSFQVATEDQAETDRYWNAIIQNGGEASACGWCKDIGRQRELDTLISMLTQSQQDSGAAVVIVGDSGMGKTSLAEAFLERVTPSWQHSGFGTDNGGRLTRGSLG